MMYQTSDMMSSENISPENSYSFVSKGFVADLADTNITTVKLVEIAK